MVQTIRKDSIAYKINMPLTTSEATQRLSLSNDEKSIEEVTFKAKRRSSSIAYSLNIPQTSQELNERTQI